jgi:ATP-binding cassette subfamily F protein 3
MRILRDEVDFEGERLLAAGVHKAVFSQEQMDQLVPHNTVLDELMSVAGDHTQGQLRNLLGTFFFRGDDVFMELALEKYRGTICLITHDRHLINSIANRILVIRNQNVEAYPGNFDDFQSIWRKRELHPSSLASEGSVAHQREPLRKKTRLRKQTEAEWRNRLFQRVTPLRELLSSLEKNIEGTTKRLDGITLEVAKEETCRNPQRLRQLTETYRMMKSQVAEWTSRWESTALKLEELEKRFEESRPKRSEKEPGVRSQKSE